MKNNTQITQILITGQSLLILTSTSTYTYAYAYIYTYTYVCKRAQHF